MGTFICLLGMGMIILSDSQHSDSSDARNPLYGDILCLVWMLTAYFDLFLDNRCCVCRSELVCTRVAMSFKKN
jgi:hypothetical protein